MTANDRIQMVLTELEKDLVNREAEIELLQQTFFRNWQRVKPAKGVSDCVRTCPVTDPG